MVPVHLADYEKIVFQRTMFNEDIIYFQMMHAVEILRENGVLFKKIYWTYVS